MKVLVVDDEKEIADLVELYLQNENYKVYKYYTGKEALDSIDTVKYDLAILDVMLPDVDGFTICKKIREKYNFPIIMVTAKEEEIDKITGLTLGADDYVTKPFRPLELIARVKAQLRRVTKYNNTQEEEMEADQNIIAFSGLVLNKETHECMLNEEAINLTPTEFKLLWILCANRGTVLSADKLFEEIWGDKYFSNSNNTIMVHIRHIREKMHETSENPKYIKTVWGVGYKVE
ncbi:MAG: VanR-ABDEGLN family response regulator transcription factor [bacterium]|nr:VanR-ABDEGLN family response regulator transcription factor [bacterium]